eukprot:1189061-Prorocentrum_minimum.AAC.2
MTPFRPTPDPLLTPFRPPPDPLLTPLLQGGSGQTENTTNRRVLVTHQDGSQTVEEITDDMDIAADDIELMRANLAKRGIDAKDISVTVRRA